VKRAAQIAALLLYACAVFGVNVASSTTSFETSTVSLNEGSSDPDASDSLVVDDDDDDDQDDVVQSETIRLHHALEQAPLSVAAEEHPSSHAAEPQLRPPRTLRA
jgi:hypothetical protein